MARRGFFVPRRKQLRDVGVGPKKMAGYINNISVHWGEQGEFEAAVQVLVAERLILIKQYPPRGLNPFISLNDIEGTAEPTVDTVVLRLGRSGCPMSKSEARFRFPSPATKETFLKAITPDSNTEPSH
ncbi:hypothetical protein MTP99_003913 [Tenebrio molitor]|nr:hypothetical protein MTP99_003913 [Tenebrio molitor]